MGQKVNPIGFRLGINKTWSSLWFADKKNFRKYLHEDIKIRGYVKKKFYHAGIAKIEIERAVDKLKINIHTARPGIVIGRKGAEIEKAKQDLEKMVTGEVIINIVEIRKPEVDAQLVAENVALQLERRVGFRRAMKRSVTSALKFGAKGVRIACAGRLGGAEMSRREWYREGRVPLHTLRADIDYGYAIARTAYGAIGIKVWVFHGEVLPGKKEELQTA
ncbi:MAG: 30S ribosomal protein S3 [Deltaproteobacteria bacterium]|nr:30S ribosomal protein S3 [Deltaproteobacteria bacterium]